MSNLNFTDGSWAAAKFATVSAKNHFFEKLGRDLNPEQEERLSGLTSETTPENILARIA